MSWASPSGVILREAMMTPMLKACPSFEPEWLEFEWEWREEKDTPQYLALAALARHLIRMLERGETETFDAVFDVVEMWHTQGDAYVREAATVGLLEDLQNYNLWPDLERADYSKFEPWLRPVSRRFWFKVIDFWENGVIIADD